MWFFVVCSVVTVNLSITRIPLEYHRINVHIDFTVYRSNTKEFCHLFEVAVLCIKIDMMIFIYLSLAMEYSYPLICCCDLHLIFANLLLKLI